MPTIVTATIGSTGDWTTLALWEDNTDNTSLVAADEIRKGLCLNEEFTSTSANLVTITGATTDATRYRELTTDTGCSFRNNANVQSNALRYNASNGAGLRVTSNYYAPLIVNEASAHISNLQFSKSGLFDGVIQTAGTTIIDNCIFDGNSSWRLAYFNSNVTVSNSVFIQRRSAADCIIDTRGALSAYNCTIVAPDDLATAPTRITRVAYTGTRLFQNCALFAGDSTKLMHTTESGGAAPTYLTCMSDISGTTGVTQVTYSSQFQDVNDATRDFRLKSGADCIDAGTTDSTHAATDIAGTSRPQGAAYDVGCWEYYAAAAFDGALFPHTQMVLPPRRTLRVRSF